MKTKTKWWWRLIGFTLTALVLLWLASPAKAEETATAVVFTHIVSQKGVSTHSVNVTVPVSMCENLAASLMSSYRVFDVTAGAPATRYWDVLCWRNPTNYQSTQSERIN